MCRPTPHDGRRLLPVVLCSFAVALCGAGAAHAQSCSIGAASGNYGIVDILSGLKVDTSATFAISCTGLANQVVRTCVEFSPGQTNAAGNRRLAAGTQRLVHEIYANPSRTTIWGSWGLSTTTYGLYPFGQTVDITLNSSGSGSVTLTAYGSVAANQTTSGPGSYVWTMSTAPAIGYDYRGSASCPTGTKQAISSGSTWTATIQANCQVSVANLSFGTVGLLNANTDSSSDISVTCTNGTPYNIGLGAGTGAGATVANRKMKSGSTTILYSLYTSNSYSSVWGETIGTDTQSGTGAGSSQVYTVYGRVFAQPTPAPGTYSDTIVLTVTY